MGEKVDMHIGGYHLTERIGTGGMGSVFLATVEADGMPVPQGQTVAVKLLHPHLRTIPEFVERFRREAMLASKINSPNVVRTFGEGMDGHHHYIVMEYVQGVKLSDLMADNQPLGPQLTIDVMDQVCCALEAAANISDDGRTCSLVHRDIKPENIIIQAVDRKPYETLSGKATLLGDKQSLANIQVKLLDFGLAKDVKALSSVLSQAGQSLGTPAYMSPEQCAGQEVDQRSDIYSLGVCAYQMITGTAPFPGPNTVAYAKQHAQEVPPDILKRNPLCPRGLANCIYKCLAKEPGNRYQSPRELRQDLMRVSQGGRVSKVKTVGAKKVAAIAAVSVLVALLAVGGRWLFTTDPAKADLNDAMQKADVAIASEDYNGAKKLLEETIGAFPNRSDKAELTAPAQKKLQDVAVKLKEVEQIHAKAQEAEAKRKHDEAAIAAIADIKAMNDGLKYQEAIDAAREAGKKFSDTPSKKELTDLLGIATGKLKAARDAQDAKTAADRQRQAAEARAAHERFIKCRDQGLAAMKAKDYPTAKVAFTNALKEEPDPDVQAMLDDAPPQRIAVIDFTEKGDVGIKDAGQTVPELLLTRFGQDKYQFVERTQLAAILKQIDLTIAVARDNPEKIYGKLKGVKYLLMGSVNKLANMTVTARIVTMATGDLVQTAEVSAEDARGLQEALGELAKVLQMTAVEKKAYQQYLAFLKDARAKAAAKEYDAAIDLYKQSLAIRSSPEIQNELANVLHDKDVRDTGIADLKKKDEAFNKQIKTAQDLFNEMPSDKSKLTENDKAKLLEAKRDVDAALGIKDKDKDALALKKHIEGYLAAGLIESACAKLAGELSQKLGKDKSLVVLPMFDQDNGVRLLGSVAAGAVQKGLLDRGMKVVDRQHLNVLLKEKELKISALVNANGQALKSAGDLASADIIVIGQTMFREKEVVLSAQASDVGTGKLLVQTSSVSVPLDGLEDLTVYTRRPDSKPATGDLPPLAIQYDFVTSGGNDEEHMPGWSSESKPNVHVAGEQHEDKYLFDGITVSSGQKFKIRFRCNSDCYVYVLLYGSQGKASVLFPHTKIGVSNAARGGAGYVVPEGTKWYYFDDQPGAEVFYIVASYMPLKDLDQLLAKMEESADDQKKQMADKVKENIDTVITRGMSPKSSGDFQPRGLNIRGVDVTDFEPCVTIVHTKKGVISPIVTGYATVVKKITMDHR